MFPNYSNNAFYSAATHLRSLCSPCPGQYCEWSLIFLPFCCRFLHHHTSSIYSQAPICASQLFTSCKFAKPNLNKMETWPSSPTLHWCWHGFILKWFTLAIQLWRYNDHPVSSKTEHYQVNFGTSCPFPVHNIFLHIIAFIFFTNSNTHPHSLFNL